MPGKPTIFLTAGFVLIEILIAIALGLVVIGGVLSVLIPTTTTWRNNAAIASMQDIEQITHDRLGRSIRQSSLIVCGDNQVQDSVTTNDSGNLTVTESTQWAFNNIKNPFRIYTASTNTDAVFGLGLGGKRLNNLDNSTVGDFFYTLTPDSLSARIQRSDAQRSSGLILDDSTIEIGDLLLVHDCRQPTIFRATSNGPSVHYDNAIQIFGHFPVNTLVSRYVPTLYYLGKLSSGRPALFARTISKTLTGGRLTITDQAILNGVVNMRLEYGIDDDLNAPVSDQPAVTGYYTAAELAVTAIPVENALTTRITLMVESDQTSANHTQTSLKFPRMDNGDEVDCIADTNPDKTACPTFIDYENKIHKVVRFVFNLPKQTAFTN